jgi:hypothetical protein
LTDRYVFVRPFPVGRPNHGGRLAIVDINSDGDLEIVSIAWDEYQFLHLWRNDAGSEGR